MGKIDFKKIVEDYPILQKMKENEEVVWVNPDKKSFQQSTRDCELTMADVEKTVDKYIEAYEMLSGD